jgi:hypothetical protein
MSKLHCASEYWKAAKDAPREAASRWLRMSAAAYVLDVRPPTRIAGRPDEIQVVAMIGKKSEALTLRAGGKEGVWVRPYYKEAQDRERFHVVQLEPGKSLEEARRAADRLGEESSGVVPTRRGFAARVLAKQREKVA